MSLFITVLLTLACSGALIALTAVLRRRPAGHRRHRYIDDHAIRRVERAQIVRFVIGAVAGICMLLLMFTPAGQAFFWSFKTYPLAWPMWVMFLTLAYLTLHLLPR
ncbi:MAG: hypothetical protein KDD69_00445 [Bdellovibrionales bacterium]|nr:hypothetical protein [Bdellovibrionales bacterium]